MGKKKSSSINTRRVTVRLPEDHHLFQYPERVRTAVLRERIEVGGKIDLLAEKLSVLAEKAESLEKKIDALQERVALIYASVSAGHLRAGQAQPQGQQQAGTGAGGDDEFKRLMLEMLKCLWLITKTKI